MNQDREFVRALSDFLALHTAQPAGVFHHLIDMFLRGAKALPKLDRTAKDQVATS